ncbi:hypothetical protein [Polaromonas sp.]|uniref:hypothetical protein n=1 Tax=Polaromonas sp. TaxID=1869339 RepID=UPI003568A3B8
MTTSYTPRDGSIPARVIQHLQTKGGSISAAQIAKKFDANPASVATLLKKSVEAGLLKATKNGNAFEWSLGTGQYIAGTLSTTLPATPYTEDIMVISAWPDGDITLQGLDPNEDGSVTLTPEQIERIAVHRPGLWI